MEDKQNISNSKEKIFELFTSERFSSKDKLAFQIPCKTENVLVPESQQHSFM